MVFMLLPVLVLAQDRKLQRAGGFDPNAPNNQQRGDVPRTVIDNREKPPVSDYKIISIKGDTTHVDTTLTVQKAYRFNYLRKDNFGLLPFSNVGKPYTKLTFSFDEPYLLPQFGARARHFNFMEVEDIFYYNVPTPWSELFFKTTFEQGQLLDAFATVNTSPQFNFFIAYKGLHSLGKYKHIMTSTGNFRAGFSYHTKNKRYDVKTHFVSQDLSNEENGGLTPLAVKHFESGAEEFDDRTLLEVKFQDAENLLLARRFYLNHYYILKMGTDSTRNNEVRIGHVLNFTDKEYHYKQKEASAWFGETYENVNLNDELEFQEVSNLGYVEYFNSLIGNLKLKISHTDYNYGYERLLILDEAIIPNRLIGNTLATGASYEKKIGGFDFHADAMINVSGDFEGNYLQADASFQYEELGKIKAGFAINSHLPNYNFLLYQSDYKNYNWRNYFKNVQVQNLFAEVTSEKLVNLKMNYSQITNYAYFGLVENENLDSQADSLVKPMQFTGTVKYIKLKANREFDFGIFSLDNTVLLQQTLDGEEVFRNPKFVARNTLYYKDYWFKKALYLQTGVTLNYFTSFEADGYDPVLAEFYIQDKQKLDGFATFDLFFNAKVSQARIFFELENFTAIFMENTNFSAPSYPYRGFAVRFGLVWDFFL